jgi:hypothetical protein
MCEYCVACCVCIANDNHGKNHSKSPDYSILRIADRVLHCYSGCSYECEEGEASCNSCGHQLCAFHWEEIKQVGKLLNDHVIDACQDCK